jgi:hypothetical protein
MVIMTDGDNDISPGVGTLNGTTYTAYGRGKETLADNRFGTRSDSSIMGKLDDAHVCSLHPGQGRGNRALCHIVRHRRVHRHKGQIDGLRHRRGHYQHASSSADLAAFFNHIAQDVLNKMIYVSK